VRFARYGRRRLVLSILFVLWLALWVFGPSVGVVIPFEVFMAGAALLVIVSLVLLILSLRAMRTDASRVLAAHPGEVAFPTRVSSWPGDRADRDGVIVVVADRRGLSFRDHADREVLLVPADRILSLELAPLVPRAPLRPFRVTTIDGDIDFSGPMTPDAQVDAVVALRQALGRAAG
jgi:hypothetical protein